MRRRGTKDENKKKGTSFFYKEAVVIALIYAVFGVLWILLSDLILEHIFPDMEAYRDFQTYKGWVFIFITTVMLFFLILDRMNLLKNENWKSLKAYDRLSTAHNELVKTKSALIYQKELTDRIINEAPVFIVAHNEEKIFGINPFGQRVSGYSQEDLLDKNWIDFLVPLDYQDDVNKRLQDIRDKKLVKDYEFPIRKKDGSYLYILWNSKQLEAETNEEDGYYISFGIDINERKQYEEKMKQLAYYDTLTGLPNRVFLEKRICQKICSNTQDNYFLIAYIDIDNFKTINDCMGHQVGDQFLTDLGNQLTSEVREPNLVARLGGDEFAILFEQTTKQEALNKVKDIVQKVSRSWMIENHQFYITMSIGIVSYPFDGKDAITLQKNAEIAMYAAKREGKNRVLCYREGISEFNIRNMRMINQLQYGLEDNQFRLYYQPQFNLKTGEVIGVEALIRWFHPEEGLIPPSDFIPVAEESGQIFELERWIVKKALEQKLEWEKQGHSDIVMSINLSGKTLTSAINFYEIELLLAKASVDFTRIVIEITETANISDIDIVIKHLNRLRLMGIRIALDDFGTGYSSLNYLKKFPINIIKLDRSFINAINENGVDILLIKNVLTLAHDLKFEVVAEGIETNEQLEFLKEGLCEAGQGYLFSKPLPVEHVNSLWLLPHRNSRQDEKA